jgi:hypothetical protein
MATRSGGWAGAHEPNVAPTANAAKSATLAAPGIQALGAVAGGPQSACVEWLAGKLSLPEVVVAFLSPTDLPESQEASSDN